VYLHEVESTKYTVRDQQTALATESHNIAVVRRNPRKLARSCIRRFTPGSFRRSLRFTAYFPPGCDNSWIALRNPYINQADFAGFSYFGVKVLKGARNALLGILIACPPAALVRKTVWRSRSYCSEES
jgi:hypothetical protein